MGTINQAEVMTQGKFAPLSVPTNYRVDYAVFSPRKSESLTLLSLNFQQIGVFLFPNKITDNIAYCSHSRLETITIVWKQI
jgi:hypothetical protein